MADAAVAFSLDVHILQGPPMDSNPLPSSGSPGPLGAGGNNALWLSLDGAHVVCERWPLPLCFPTTPVPQQVVASC